MDNRYDCRYSIVIPLYRSAPTIKAVVDEVTEELARISVSDYEIILVNDCSPDNVLDVVCEMAQGNEHLVVIDLAKNVGQSHAIMAGLAQATGDFIITMDDDMQTPGYELGNLIDAIHDRDDDIVFASYDQSEDKRSFVRSFGTKLNWWMAEHFAGKPKGLETNSFLIMRKIIRDAYVMYSGRKIYSFGIMFRLTSHVSNLRMKRRPRAVGESGYTLKKLASMWLTGVLSFSTVPLRTVALIGAILFVLSVIGMVVAAVIGRFYIGLFWGMGLICALLLLVLGLIGEYIGRIFDTESNLPGYIIRNRIDGRSSSVEGAESE